MRRLVLRSGPLRRESTEARDSMDTERLLRFPRVSFLWRRGGGEREREREPRTRDTSAAALPPPPAFGSCDFVPYSADFCCRALRLRPLK